MSCIAKSSLCALAIFSASTGVWANEAAPAYLQPQFERLADEGERNAVLNQMEIGARAFVNGDDALSAEYLDYALTTIESLYSNKEGADKARSLWYSEGSKDYRGEPYERVMAYYYRGLLYLKAGDLGNARASFEGGMLQDAFAEEEQNRFDFALMAYLSAWASFLEGNDSMLRDSWKEVKTLRPDTPAFSKGMNKLLVVETGFSPRKLRDGVGHYELVYRRGKKFKEEKVKVTLAGNTRDVQPMEDIFWQASSRGGRAVDRIIKGKASFRATNAGVGGVLVDTASTLQVLQPLGGSLGGAAAAIGGVGAVSLFIASKVNAKADDRYWSAIPDAVHVMPFKGKAGDKLTVSFFDKSGQPLPELTQEVVVPAKGSLVWARSQPPGKQPEFRD